MKSSTYLIRLRRLILLGAVVAGIAVPAAGASFNGSPPDVRDVANTVAGTFDGSPPDIQDAAAALHFTSAGLTADGLRLQGIAQVYKQIQPTSGLDVFERYATAHPYGTGVSQVTSSTFASRPPDVSDAAQAVRYGVSVDQSSGFDWGDWAIGIGSGMGLILILGSGLVMAQQRRHRTLTA
jgi:hypothetical protein